MATYAEFLKIVDALTKDGKKITYENVRSLLHVSDSTIARFMREYKQAKSVSSVNRTVPQSLVEVFAKEVSLIEERMRQDYNDEITDLRAFQESLAAENDRLSKELEQSLEKLRVCEETSLKQAEQIRMLHVEIDALKREVKDKHSFEALLADREQLLKEHKETIERLREECKSLQHEVYEEKTANAVLKEKLLQKA
jgi:chromosome segregation ATPase